MTDQIIANRMRKLRENAGLTQKEVAALLHMERQTYGNYENCKRKPNVLVLANLSEIYHVSVDYFTCSEQAFNNNYKKARRL